MIFRAGIFHTPRNAFQQDPLEAFADGALLVRDGKIADCGDYAQIRAAHPESDYTDLRGGFIVPGMIDTHTHFPQLRIVGNLGLSLLDWLDQCALPEESRMADLVYARETARGYLDALAAHGTTTALVFGSHFASATAALFEAAAAKGLRIFSGLVLSDRALRPELHVSPEAAYRDSKELIRRFENRYAVTPRFALSTSEAMLEVCQALLREHAGVRFQTHINENRDEIAAVARAFPWASDYLSVYERWQLTGRRSIMAHDVHATASEMERLAASQTPVAHCPTSNAALGSGIFPMRAHVRAGVHCALGTDIGAGTTFSLMRTALQAYFVQRLAPEPMILTPAQMLYLATRAGAEALDLQDEIGDFQPGKSADFVYILPAKNSPLAHVLERAEDFSTILGVLLTLADATSICEVRVAGERVYVRADAD